MASTPYAVPPIAIDSSYLYPIDLLELLVDTIPRLIKSKAGLIDFFAAAGTPPDVLAEWRNKLDFDRGSVNKFQITRSVLRELNRRKERARTVRLEILRRIANSKDFSTGWDDDREKAERLVRWLREIAGEKDARTWAPALEVVSEQGGPQANHRQRIRAAEERRRALDELKHDVYSVVSLAEKLRGPAFAATLPRLFGHFGMPATEPFVITPAGGYGAIEFEGRTFLVESRWQPEPIGRRELGEHMVRVYGRPGGAGGLYISASGYSESALDECANARNDRPVVLFHAESLFMLLEFDGDLKSLLSPKGQAGVIDGTHFLPKSGIR